MTNNKIIAIVGMCGSGKSVLADELVKRGWGYVRFGQLTIDLIKERGLEVNEANEKSVRENLRKEHGMGAYAKLNIPKFDAVLEKQNLIADGLYSWDEYKILKDYYGDRLLVVCVYAPPALRYGRLEKRKIQADDKDVKYRPLTQEQAKARDFAEIENLAKGGPIAMADYLITNTGTLEEYLTQINKFLTIVSN